MYILHNLKKHSYNLLYLGQNLSQQFSNICITFIDKLLGSNPGHLLTLLRKYLLDILLSVQIRKPTQIVGDQVIVLAPVTLSYHYALLVGKFGYCFRVSVITLFARERQQ